MEMGINMKVDGTIANEQDKEHIGFMREKIKWGENIPGIGWMIRKLVEEQCFIKIVIDMMDYGWMTSHMVREEWYIQMGMCMKACGLWV